MHEFELSVTDSYGAETLEVVTIEVGGEPNKLPVGTARAYKKVNSLCKRERFYSYRIDAYFRASF